MSNFIQLEQAFRRFNPDPPAGDVDLDADVGGQRDQYFTTRALDHQPASTGATVHPNDRPHRRARSRFHRATHQLVLVVAARLERLQRFFRNPQLEPGKLLGGLDARQSFEADDRPAVLHPRGGNRELFVPPRQPRPQRRAGPEPFRDEIRFWLDDDVAAETVGPRHAADDRHVIPVSHSPRRVRPAEPAPRTSISGAV